MAQRPIFVATHPRACSTAFERVFMTRRDSLQCVHEPFGDAFYYGTERLSDRYEDDEQARLDSGFNQTTYQTVFERLDREASEVVHEFTMLRCGMLTNKQGKRLFIKDMAYYLMPLDGTPADTAPSLDSVKRGIGTNGTVTNGNGSTNGSVTNGGSVANGRAKNDGNPTVVPVDQLEQFHFTFLIRDPHYSIPSYYRCTIPPLDELTGFTYFDEAEAGYDQLRRLFDYLRKQGLVGPHNANKSTNGVNVTTHTGDEICVVDADALLDNPFGVVERFCDSVNEDFTPDMLAWDSDEEQALAHAAFAKWPGFHEDVLNSDGLQARKHSKPARAEADFDEEWREKYGEEAAQLIRSAVDHCMPDYLYMKKFALKV